MKSTCLILLTIFVLEMQCPLPPCNLAGHRDFIYVMTNKMENATRCVDRKLKNLLGGNVDVTKCTALHGGKNYTILRRMRESTSYAQWDFCSDPTTNKFDMQFCQFNKQCYDKQWIKNYLKPGEPKIDDSCQALIEALKEKNPNAYERLFVDNTWGCSFRKVVSIAKWRNTFRDIKLVIHPPSTNHIWSVDRCRLNQYNNVFYRSNNTPTFCVIPDLGMTNRRCIGMESLFKQMGMFDKEPFKSIHTGDYSPEYKRYIYKHRLAIYDQDSYDDLPRRNALYKPFNSNFNIPNKKKTLLDEADIPFLHSTKEQETFERSKSQYIDRPTFFCDLYLTHFPFSTEEIRRNTNNGRCSRMTENDELNNAKCKTIKGTVVYELVVYDKYGPKGCYIPPQNVDSNRSSACVPFTEAERLLNMKNNNDEDLDPALAIAEIDEVGQKPVKHYRRNYMAGRLRLHQAAHIKDTYHQPEWYFWSNLRRNNNTIQDILRAISAALGYENDEIRLFTINNPWNGPPGNLTLSVNAFCRAIVEMIPFSRKDFQSMDTIEDGSILSCYIIFYYLIIDCE